MTRLNCFSFVTHRQRSDGKQSGRCDSGLVGFGVRFTWVGGLLLVRSYELGGYWTVWHGEGLVMVVLVLEDGRKRDNESFD